MLPETILIRNVALIGGALLGMIVCYKLRRQFQRVSVVPLLLILGLFIWVSAHLIFFSNDFNAQYDEYRSIWKRVALSAIFAVGLGLALGQASHRMSERYWRLIFIGLMMPSLIYLVKFALTSYGMAGFEVPAFLKLYRTSSPYYIPKTAYVSFCLPVFAMALGGLEFNIRHWKGVKPSTLIYIVSLVIILFLFASEMIKNGILYGLILLGIFFIRIVLSLSTLKKKLIIGFVLIMLLLSIFSMTKIQNEYALQSFRSDLKVSLDIEGVQHWKYNGKIGYPQNDIGRQVSSTNYERIAWGAAGIKLLKEYPMGYGLVEQSFGRLAKIRWPDSTLSQSHSGWLDLALGIGMPGVLMLLISLLAAMALLYFPSRGQENSFWCCTVRWPLLAILLMWCTTELSQKVFLDCMVFWVCFAGGIVVAIFFNSKRRGLTSDVVNVP